MGKFNRILDLEIEAKALETESLVKCAVAHARGKTVYCNTGKPLLEKGKSYSVKQIVSAMDLGAKCGEKLFANSSCYKDSYIVREESDLESSDDGESDRNSDPEIDLSDSNVSYRKQLLRKLTVQHLNGGKTTFNSSARRRKFFSKAFSEPGFYSAPCHCRNSKINVGKHISGTFAVKKAKRWAPQRWTAEVLFISKSLYATKDNSGSKSSVSLVPAKTICTRCDVGLRFWIRKGGVIFLCNSITLQRSKRKRG